MLNFCSFPANSRHNAALLPFDFARSVFLLIQQLFAYFLINTHIFITVLFRKPFSSFSAQIAKSPFNRNYPETPCSPPTENRPNIPRNSDRFHPRTFSESFYFRSIPNDTNRSPANFRSFLNKKDPKHVSVPWVLIGSFGETLGCFGGEGLRASKDNWIIPQSASISNLFD